MDRIAAITLTVLLCFSMFSVLTPKIGASSSGDHTYSTVQTAEDSWPMFRHDMEHTGYSTSEAPDAVNVLWSFKSPRANAAEGSSPAVVGGIVYMASSDGSVYALDAATGTLIWSYYQVYWISSSPAVSEGMVFVGLGSGGVFALDAATGALIWSHPLGGGLCHSSPAVAGGKVYIGSNDGNVYAFDAATGTLVWSYPTGNVWSSPAVANGIVYVGGWGAWRVFALDAATGTLVWSYTTGASIWSSPAVANGNVYIGSSDNKVYALNAATGTLIWSHATGDEVWSSPAVADGKVFVGSEDHKVYALDAVTGTDVWSYTTGGGISSSPAVAGGNVYISSWDGKIYAFGPAEPSDPLLSLARSYEQVGENTYLWERILFDGKEYRAYLFSTVAFDPEVLRSGFRPTASQGITGFVIIDCSSQTVVQGEDMAKLILQYAESSAAYKSLKGEPDPGSPYIQSWEYRAVAQTAHGDLIFASNILSDKGVDRFVRGGYVLGSVNLLDDQTRRDTYKTLIVDSLVATNVQSRGSSAEAERVDLAWDMFTIAEDTLDFYSKSQLIEGIERISDKTLSSAIDASKTASFIDALGPLTDSISVARDIAKAIIAYYTLDLVREEYILSLESYIDFLQSADCDPAMILGIQDAVLTYRSESVRGRTALLDAVARNPLDFLSFANDLAGLAGIVGTLAGTTVGVALFYVELAYTALDIMFGMTELYRYLPETSLAITTDFEMLLCWRSKLSELDVTGVVDADALGKLNGMRTLELTSAYTYYTALEHILSVYNFGWWFDKKTMQDWSSYLQGQSGSISLYLSRDVVPLLLTRQQLIWDVSVTRGITALELSIEIAPSLVLTKVNSAVHLNLALSNPSYKASYSSLTVICENSKKIVSKVAPSAVSLPFDSSSTFDLTLTFKKAGIYVLPIKVQGTRISEAGSVTVAYEVFVTVAAHS